MGRPPTRGGAESKVVHLRLDPARKAHWVQVARERGKTLSDAIVQAMDAATGYKADGSMRACPFCGHLDSLQIYHEPGTDIHPWYCVRCDNCGARGPGDDHGDHIANWNGEI